MMPVFVFGLWYVIEEWTQAKSTGMKEYSSYLWQLPAPSSNYSHNYNTNGRIWWKIGGGDFFVTAELTFWTKLMLTDW